MSDDYQELPAAPKRRGPSLLGLLIVLVALVVAGGGAVYGGKRLLARFGDAPDYAGPGSGRVVVQVRPGATATDIGAELQGKDVVKSIGAFTEAASNEPRSRSIQPGFYALRAQMKAALALALLLDPASRLRSRFTVPEGTTLARTLQIIASSVDGMPLATLQSAARDTAALNLPSWAGDRLEGLLFPATYDVEPGTSATEVLSMMVRRFEQSAETLDLEARARTLGRTPYEILVVASLVEGETPKETERGKVSRVVYNRLAKRMRLEFDSTIKYAYELRGERKTRLLYRDLEIDSPYNTYRRAGLPPTPISSPGDAALEAALTPSPGPWLYFVVVDKQGNSEFTDSYQEFLRLKERYRRDVLGGG